MNISLNSNDINTAVVNFLKEEYSINLDNKTCKVDFVMGRNGNGLRAQVEISKNGDTVVPDKPVEEMLEELQENDLIPDTITSLSVDATEPLFKED